MIDVHGIQVGMLGKQLERARAELAEGRREQEVGGARLEETVLLNESLQEEIRDRAAKHRADQHTLKQLHATCDALHRQVAEKREHSFG
jgi:hypothetical protein